MRGIGMSDNNRSFNVADTNSRGYGIIKEDGKIIFAADSVEGDVCRIEITGEEKNYLTARVTEIVSPSPYRIEPDCPYYKTCGGCSLRHVTYEKEGEIKQKVVSSAFRRFGLEVDVENALCPSPDGYRNKVSFKVDGHRVGFFRKETKSVVSLDGPPCKTAPDGFTQTAKDITGFLYSLNISAEDITIRSSSGGALSVMISVNALSDKFRELIRFKEVLSSLSVRESSTGKTVRIFGGGGIPTEAFGLSLFVSDDSFFQVNYEGAEALFGVISSAFDGIRFDLCADLFCGTGVWGLALAKRFPDKRFYGVDLNESAILDAKKNAEVNRLSNIKFYHGDASMKIEDSRPDAVIVDPPRAGLRAGMIEAMKTLSPQNVVYVSCDPFTLARDVKKLTEFGYCINNVKPINLFPRTEHVETVVLMTRTGTGNG